MKLFNKVLYGFILTCTGLFSIANADNQDLIIENIKRGNLKVLKTLINKENANELLCVDGIEMTPFYLACKKGQSFIIRWFMQFKPDVNIEINGSYSLHEVVKNDLTSTALLLIVNGADLKKENIYGETPQSIAKRLSYKGMSTRLNQVEKVWDGQKLDFNKSKNLLLFVTQEILASTMCCKDKFYYLREIFKLGSCKLRDSIVGCFPSKFSEIEDVVGTLDDETSRENEEAVAFWKQEIEKSKSSSFEEN